VTPGVAFALWVLVNAVLFLRPAEIIDDLQGANLYEVLILACAVCSAPALFRRLTSGGLTREPITLAVVGLLAAIVGSHLVHGHTWEARASATKFFKVALYYLLLLVNLNSLARLRLFLLCLAGLIAGLSILALLQYHGVIDIAALRVLEERQYDQEIEEYIVITRLRSTGIFNDPNDLSLMLLTGMAICTYGLTDRRLLFLRLFWAAPLLLFGYALTLTQSRGGFLGLLAGMVVLFHARFGRTRALLLAGLALPLMFALFAGRQTNIDLGNNEDTSQARIQLWSEGLDLFREAPLFGVGHDQYAERATQVAHNSFVHCFAELGLFGGALFLGAFWCAGQLLRRTAPRPAPSLDPELQRLRPYLLAGGTAYAVGLLSLSRSYVEPTYLVLGLVAVFGSLASQSLARPLVVWDGRTVWAIALTSVVFLVVTYGVVRVCCNWN
jgi:O-antigen ligase